mmetsp:Transcript_64997/g.188432  ORF Transcript_64997/g.188432 Transcript_64997/m.188432 type:complete len:304 (-) Transcript_64997:1225-2136(-)
MPVGQAGNHGPNQRQGPKDTCYPRRAADRGEGTGAHVARPRRRAGCAWRERPRDLGEQVDLARGVGGQGGGAQEGGGTLAAAPGERRWHEGLESDDGRHLEDEEGLVRLGDHPGQGAVDGRDPRGGDERRAVRRLEGVPRKREGLSRRAGEVSQTARRRAQEAKVRDPRPDRTIRKGPERAPPPALRARREVLLSGTLLRAFAARPYAEHRGRACAQAVYTGRRGGPREIARGGDQARRLHLGGRCEKDEAGRPHEARARSGLRTTLPSAVRHVRAGAGGDRRLAAALPQEEACRGRPGARRW